MHPTRSTLTACALVAALAFAISLVAIALALAAGASLSVGSAANKTLGEQVVVDAQGRTLYALSPETTSHLLCKSSQCLKLWPPLSVRSRAVKLKAGPGVHGRLAILRRSGGTLQVTLGGRPLYRFSGDSARGEANGQGIKSFGGSWHAVTASPTTGVSPPATPTTPSTPTTPTTPTYPGY